MQTLLVCKVFDLHSFYLTFQASPKNYNINYKTRVVSVTLISKCTQRRVKIRMFLKLLNLWIHSGEPNWTKQWINGNSFDITICNSANYFFIGGKVIFLLAITSNSRCFHLTFPLFKSKRAFALMDWWDNKIIYVSMRIAECLIWTFSCYIYVRVIGTNVFRSW